MLGKAKRCAVLFLIVAVFFGPLYACTGPPHQHEWSAATCTEPATCSACGEKDGDPLGHDWQEAACAAPMICSRCGKTKGSRLGHDWQDATCTIPKTCSRCGEAKGFPLGHKWQDATCTTPKTCSRCGETDGDLQHYFISYYWSTSIEPTCQAEGEESNSCFYCGDTATRSVPAIDHIAGDWQTIEAATASAPGVKARFCTMCGLEMEREEYDLSASVDGSHDGGASVASRSGFNTYDSEDQQATTAKYVLNTRSGVFHKPSCRDVKRIAPQNYSTSSKSREELRASGYRACGHCSP